MQVFPYRVAPISLEKYWGCGWGKIIVWGGRFHFGIGGKSQHSENKVGSRRFWDEAINWACDLLPSAYNISCVDELGKLCFGTCLNNKEILSLLGHKHSNYLCCDFLENVPKTASVQKEKYRRAWKVGHLCASWNSRYQTNAWISMVTPACYSEGICCVARQHKTLDQVICSQRRGAQRYTNSSLAAPSCLFSTLESAWALLFWGHCCFWRNPSTPYND